MGEKTDECRRRGIVVWIVGYVSEMLVCLVIGRTHRKIMLEWAHGGGTD